MLRFSVKLFTLTSSLGEGYGWKHWESGVDREFTNSLNKNPHPRGAFTT